MTFYEVVKIGVKEIFSEVPKTYEIINHVLTFGMDILWRKLED